MTFLQKIKILFSKKSLDGFNPFNAISTFGSSDYQAPFNYNQLINSLQGYAFSCIHKRAKYVSGLGIYPARENADGDIEPIENHWLNEIVKNPYKPAALTMNEILYHIQMSKDITGNAYIWTPLNGTSKPQQMLVLSPNDVKIKLNNDTFGTVAESYEWRRGANVITIPANEICHINTYNILSGGTFNEGSPMLLNAVTNVIGADKEIISYIVEYFKNNAIPPLVGVNTSGAQLTETGWERFKAGFKESLPAHVPKILLDFGMDVRPLQTSQGATLKDSLVNVSISTEIRKRIAAAFEIPDAMLTSDFNTRSDAGYILQWFHSDTIEVERDMIDDKLTRHFQQFDDSIIITHDAYDYVDPAHALAEKQMLLSFGVITKNEMRAEYGYEQIDEPEPAPPPVVEEPPQEESPVEEDQNAMPSEKALYSMKDYNKFTEKMKKDLWTYKVKQDENFEKSIKEKTVSVFDALGKEVVKNLKKQKSFKKKDFDIESVELFDIDEWQKNLTTKVTPEIRALMIDSMRRAIENYSYDGSLTNFTQEIADTINDLWKRTDSFKTISEDLNAKFKDIIKSNPRATNAELLNKLLTETNYLFENQYKTYNAERIARTSTTFTSSKADLIVIEEVGLTSVWMSERDGKVRATHLDADGSEPDEDGYFTVGGDKMQHPAGGSDAGENVNCRCRLFAQKKEK